MSQTVVQPEVSGPGTGTGRWMVVIFNNDTNSMDQVVNVLIKATGCDMEEASIETWEAHTYGKALCISRSRRVRARGRHHLGDRRRDGGFTRMGGLILAALPVIIEEEQVSRGGGGLGDGWIVTVYNNEKNTYDEVISVLLVATGCTPDEAYIETWEIDHLGKSVVHYACESECRDVATIIGKIGIRVEVTAEA